MPSTDEIATAVTSAIIDVGKLAPVNLQDEKDVDAHNLYVMSRFYEAIGKQYESRIENLKKRKRASATEAVTFSSEHYLIDFAEGTAANRFDVQLFIDNVAAAFKIPKHKLIELQQTSTKQSAAPLTVTITMKE